MQIALRLFRTTGVDLFCLNKKFLVFNLVARNLKTKYRRSIFGIFWTVLTPVATAAVYYFVFKLVLKVTMPHYLVFILSGVLPWNFFSQSLLEGMDSIYGQTNLVTKIPVPIQVFPFSGTITNLVTFIISIPILLGAALISQAPIGLPVLLLPFYFVCLFLICYCLALVLAMGYVFFRDLKHVMGIILQLWLYGTPVIYDEALIPEKFHWILYANPVGLIFSGIHQTLVKSQWPAGIELLVICLWTAVIFWCALMAHVRWSGLLAEQL